MAEATFSQHWEIWRAASDFCELMSGFLHCCTICALWECSYRWSKSQNKTCWWFPVSYSLSFMWFHERYHSPSRCTRHL